MRWGVGLVYPVLPRVSQRSLACLSPSLPQDMRNPPGRSPRCATAWLGEVWVRLIPSLIQQKATVIN